MRRRRWSSLEATLLCAETGLSDPVVAMQRLAADLIDFAGFQGPPFDPEMLASLRNVCEVRRVRMNGAARLIPDGQFLRIEVNQDHSSGKQNFSIDHESSHTLIPTYANEQVDDQETGAFRENGEEELLCDIGAAALLLDPRWLAGFAYEANPSIAFLRGTATTFLASWEATARQLAIVSPWPAAFVFWEEGFRKKERIPPGQLVMPGVAGLAGCAPKLRVMRCYSTKSFPHRLYRNKSISDLSLVTACNDTDQLTFGVESIPLGTREETVRLYSENLYAPYRRDGALRRRVISLLLPIDQQTDSPESFASYELEAF